MRFCQSCVIPDTRPNIEIDSTGVCNACRAHNTRPYIDWKSREKSFAAVVENAKERSRGYDCLIPVSGGKDSIWQVMKCLEYGLTPLAVTWKTPGRTQLGQHNLDCLLRLGVDHVDYRVSPTVERKFVYQSFKKYGSTAIPMHMAIFNIPLTLAVRLKIPLIVWGENSAFEYGGKKEEQTGFQLDQKWLSKYGVTHGTTAKDWVGEHLTAKQLTPYFGPGEAELDRSGVLAVFLGYYFPWDPRTSLQSALSSGFRVREEGPKTGYYNYADIDDDFISIHHWLKWYKFGFTRLFDNLSIEIRNGRIAREDAIRCLEDHGTQTPHADIEKLCDFLQISVERFYAISETFRNRSIWSQKSGQWVIEPFITEKWNWHADKNQRSAA